MADPVDSAQSTLQPAAAPTPTPSQPATENPPQQSLPIRDGQAAKGPAQQEKQPAKPKDAAAPAAAGAEKALTPGELKKQAKAEKAARRAKEKLERDSGGAGAAGSPAPGAGQARPPSTPKKDAGGGGASQKGQKVPPPRRGSGPIAQTAAVEQKKKKEDKSVAVFGHLYGQQRRTTIAGAGKEVHPAVLALGLQMRDYVVCGSNARCVATLVAFKRVSISRFPGGFVSIIIGMLTGNGLGRRIVHYAPGYFVGAPLDNTPFAPDHLSLDMPTTLYQPG